MCLTHENTDNKMLFVNEKLTRGKVTVGGSNGGILISTAKVTLLKYSLLLWKYYVWSLKIVRHKKTNSIKKQNNTLI
jgi:hypothetical protein